MKDNPKIKKEKSTATLLTNIGKYVLFGALCLVPFIAPPVALALLPATIGIELFNAFLIAGVVIPSAFVGLYAIKRTIKSLLHLYHGEKILRSLLTLTAIGLGIAIAISPFGVAFASALGTALTDKLLLLLPSLVTEPSIPVITTIFSFSSYFLVGFTIALFANIGAYLSKHIPRYRSAMQNEDAINPTYPEKWMLSDGRKSFYLDRNTKNISISSLVDRRLFDIRNRKKELKHHMSSWSSLWDSPDESKKMKEEINDINRELDEIKRGHFQLTRKAN